MSLAWEFSHVAYVISYSVKHIIYVCILNESEYRDLFSALERKKNPIRAFGKVIFALRKLSSDSVLLNP